MYNIYTITSLCYKGGTFDPTDYTLLTFISESPFYNKQGNMYEVGWDRKQYRNPEWPDQVSGGETGGADRSRKGNLPRGPLLQPDHPHRGLHSTGTGQRVSVVVTNCPE